MKRTYITCSSSASSSSSEKEFTFRFLDGKLLILSVPTDLAWDFNIVHQRLFDMVPECRHRRFLSVCLPTENEESVDVDDHVDEHVDEHVDVLKWTNKEKQSEALRKWSDFCATCPNPDPIFVMLDSPPPTVMTGCVMTTPIFSFEFESFTRDKHARMFSIPKSVWDRFSVRGFCAPRETLSPMIDLMKRHTSQSAVQITFVTFGCPNLIVRVESDTVMDLINTSVSTFPNLSELSMERLCMRYTPEFFSRLKDVKKLSELNAINLPRPLLDVNISGEVEWTDTQKECVNIYTECVSHLCLTNTCAPEKVIGIHNLFTDEMYDTLPADIDLKTEREWNMWKTTLASSINFKTYRLTDLTKSGWA